MPSPRELLAQHTVLVADTADPSQIAALRPQDVTTNPSLVLKALSQPAHHELLAQARTWAGPLTHSVDRLLVHVGSTLLQQIPGRVSAEVDPRLSFDADATRQRALQLLALFAKAGVPQERVLIKIAATWEGIAAARTLQAQGVRTNLTLVFGLTQAVACAQAQVQLISPFVGRIYDWHKKAAGPQWDEAAHAGLNDPGVQSVRAIYTHFKRQGYGTEIMGASFRNLGQIWALSGCDLLTISPELLQQLDFAPLPAHPVPALIAHAGDSEPAPHAGPHGLVDESGFRWALNEDAMASEKLAEGLRLFAADTRKLEALLAAPMP
jgi:transaldolase